MHHCVYANRYYRRSECLIMTAIVGEKHVETIEVNLKSFQIVQSRAVCNGTSEYHDCIIRLVEKNMSLIKKLTAWTSITQNPDSTARNSLHAGASPCTNAGSTKADWMNAGDVRLYTVKPRRLPVRKPEERFVRIADVPFRSTGSITGLSDVGIRNTDVSPPGARCVWVKSQRKEIVIINLKIQWKT